MIDRFGDMFGEVLGKKDNLIVTTNSYIKLDGSLVMGRGAAKTLMTLVPNIAEDFGIRIDHFSEYFLKDSGITYKGTKLWAFQVKRHFKSKADIYLIKTSTQMLVAEAKRNEDREYHVNYPGIGNGQLKFDDVKDVVKILPNNVFLWRFK